MLQFPTLMSQFPSSTKTIPASYLLPLQWPQPHNEEILLAMEEAEFEEKCNEIRKMSPSLPVIGKPVKKKTIMKQRMMMQTMQRNLMVKSSSKKPGEEFRDSIRLILKTLV